MSWAKRNLYFLISCIVAVVLLGAAGWYCYSEWQSNNSHWEELSGAYGQLTTISQKNPGAGNDAVDNIKAAKEQAQDVKVRVVEMEKFFAPVRGIPDTNHFEDRVLAGAVRNTISQLRSSAAQHSVTLPGTQMQMAGQQQQSDFAFSFTLQAGKTVYDPNSWDQLSKQLGEVKTICDILYSCRINALDAIQRERTADEGGNNGMSASGPDYLDNTSVTNGNTVVTPYQVTFECFTPELGNVLSSFANQQHTIVVKTLDVQPVDANNGMMEGSMMQNNGMPSVVNTRGGLPVVIDEKKLKVIMLLDFVKIIPAQGS
jgi:predicted negative regulator of RcsB-dependent stress response